MDRTACTEPQCLYKGALYFYLTIHQDTNTTYEKIKGVYMFNQVVCTQKPLRFKELKSNNSYINSMADYFTVHKSGLRLCS